MIVFAKKKKTSLWFLSQVLTLITKAREIYADYLNTNSDDYLSDLCVPRNFQICYCNIIDRKLIPEEYFPLLDNLIEKHNKFLNKAIDKKSEEVFTLLAYFHQETKKLFFSELKRKKITVDINSKDLNYKIVEITEYEKESDPETFIEDFKKNLFLKN